MNKIQILVSVVSLALGACAVPQSKTSTPAPAAAPAAAASDAIKVPAGNKSVMTLLGTGDLAYECKANAAGAFEWTFAGPTAQLIDKDKKVVGKYYGGPTWESMDGSKITGKQLAVSPGPAGAIPLQLVQTTPAMGKGSMEGVTYIQRVNTVGGVAPKDMPCSTANAGAKTSVKYSADYVFYKAQ